MFETKKDFWKFLRELAVVFLGASPGGSATHRGKSLAQVILSTFLFVLPIALSAHFVRGQKKQFRWKGFVLFSYLGAGCMHGLRLAKIGASFGSGNIQSHHESLGCDLDFLRRHRGRLPLASG